MRHEAILPHWGRWQPGGLTEGAGLAQALLQAYPLLQANPLHHALRWAIACRLLEPGHGPPPPVGEDLW